MGTLYGQIGGLHLVDETSVSSDLLTYLRLLPPEGHRPPTSVLQAPLSSALFSSWFHVCPILLMSASISLRQVFLGRPRLRFPCGFHLRACLVILLGGLRSVCPIQRHRRFLISSSTGSWFVLCQRSMLLMVLGQYIRRIFRRQLLMNT